MVENYSHERDRTAIDPYIVFHADFCICQKGCELDQRCNGYSFDFSNETCSLSTCDTYNSSITCHSCRFFSKINSTSTVLCETISTMSIDTTSESVSLITIKQTTIDEQQTTIERTTPEEQQTTIEHAISENRQETKEQATNEQSTKKEQTTSVKQHTTDIQLTTMEHSTIKKLSTSEEQSTRISWSNILTSSSNTMTINNTTQNTVNSAFCTCICKYTNKTLEESIKERRRDLILNKTELSFNIRKRSSAGDNRKTSRVVGAVGTIILALYGLLFFFADIWTFLAICPSNMFHKNNQIEPNV